MARHTVSVRVTVAKAKRGYTAQACTWNRRGAAQVCSKPRDPDLTALDARPTSAVARALRELGSRLDRAETPRRSAYGLGSAEMPLFDGDGFTRRAEYVNFLARQIRNLKPITGYDIAPDAVSFEVLYDGPTHTYPARWIYLESTEAPRSSTRRGPDDLGRVRVPRRRRLAKKR